MVTWGAVKGAPDRGRSSRPLTAPHVTYNRAGNEAQRSSVGLRSLVDSVFSSYWHAFRDASELSASIIPVRSQKYIDRRFVPLRFSKSCLQPPLLPGFYPHSQGATWGPVHVGVRSQTWPRHNRDGARLVWVLPSDWRSLGIWPFPAVTRTRRVDVVAANLSDNESASASSTYLLFTGFCLFAIASVKFYGTWLGPAYAAVACAVLISVPV